MVWGCRERLEVGMLSRFPVLFHAVLRFLQGPPWVFKGCLVQKGQCGFIGLLLQFLYNVPHNVPPKKKTKTLNPKFP